MLFNQSLVNLVKSVFNHGIINDLNRELHQQMINVSPDDSAFSRDLRDVLMKNDYNKSLKWLRAHSDRMDVRLLVFTEKSKSKSNHTSIEMKGGPAAFCVKRNLKHSLKAVIDSEYPLEFAQTDRDVNPLLLSVMEGQYDLAKDLLDANVNPSPLCRLFRKTTTPLMYASRFIRPEFASLLLNYGADINQQDVLGNTALFYANSKAMALLLTDAGADPLIKNNEGATALDLISNGDAVNIIKNYQKHIHGNPADIGQHTSKIRRDKGVL